MKFFQLIAFLLFFYDMKSQTHIVESSEKICVLYNVKNGIDVVDTLFSCSSCTLAGEYLYSIKYIYPSFNPPPVLLLSKWKIKQNKITLVSNMDFKFESKVAFDRISFTLSNGFLIGSYKSSNCNEIVNKKIMLIDMSQSKLNQFFIGFFSEIPSVFNGN